MTTLSARGAGRIYTFDTLPEKGISFHRNYIRRLVKAGKFPAPFYMSERRPAWTETTIDSWILERQEMGNASAKPDRKAED